MSTNVELTMLTPYRSDITSITIIGRHHVLVETNLDLVFCIQTNMLECGETENIDLKRNECKSRAHSADPG